METRRISLSALFYLALPFYKNRKEKAKMKINYDMDWDVAYDALIVVSAIVFIETIIWSVIFA